MFEKLRGKKPPFELRVQQWDPQTKEVQPGIPLVTVTELDEGGATFGGRKVPWERLLYVALPEDYNETFSSEV
jgi:hypothetical protein